MTLLKLLGPPRHRLKDSGIRKALNADPFAVKIWPLSFEQGEMKKTPRPPPRTGLRFVTVTRNLGGPPHQGLLIAGVATFRCALGRKGLVRVKREGDGRTPIGAWRLLGFRHRPLRLRRAGLRLPTRDIRPLDLWCDDSESFFYNRSLRAPSRFRCERLWRGDALYDVVGVLDYNLRPAKRGRGSAIFFHIATQDLAPTEGCVALRARDMARLAPRLARGAALVIR